MTRLELWRQDRFDPRRVVIHDTTAQWATLTLTGPRSRDLLAALDLGVALDDESLPHMAFTTAAFDGAPLSVARVSFTGDRSYELSVPAGRARSLARAHRRETARFRRRPLGTRSADDPARREGLHRRRQGHGRHDHAARSRRPGPREQRKDEYIGKRSLFTAAAKDRGRKQLVGLSVGSGEAPLPTGAHVVTGAGKARRSLGYVTSSYMSPTLGRPVALGLVEDGLARMGESVGVYHLGARAARDDRACGRVRSGRKAAPCVR